MSIHAVAVAFMLFFIASLLPTSDAVCKSPKEGKTWRRKSLLERAIQSDIVIYGEVFFSPCWKPGFVKPTNAPLTTTPTQVPSGVNSTNTTSNTTGFLTTPSPTKEENATVNTTTLPITDVPYNCSTEYYDAIIKVLCVLKGGSVPLLVNLEGLGHGEGVCLDESHHDHHAYRMLKYLIFIGRKKIPDEKGQFRIYPVNYQPALKEIEDESELEPIFEAIGRNAHLPINIVNQKDHAMCKPYVGSAHACCSSLLMILFVCISYMMY